MRCADGEVDEELEPVFEIEKPPPPPGPSRATVIAGVVLYAVCSSTLLVINKVSITALFFLPSSVDLSFLSTDHLLLT